jgi:hypothetical protein
MLSGCVGGLVGNRLIEGCVHEWLLLQSRILQTKEIEVPNHSNSLNE